MICPNCESEYVDGVKECADCGIELITHDQFTKVHGEEQELSMDDWKEVFSSIDPIEIEMMKANLKGAEIESVPLSKQDRTKLSVFDVGSTSIKLFVKKEDAEAAIQIVIDINSSEIKEDE